MTIEKINNSIVFNIEETQYVFPINSIYTINIGDIITVRLKGNRRNLFSFNYHEVTNVTATDVDDFINNLNNLMFK